MITEIKYVHPENPELSWTGKGRQPKWVEFYLSNGGTLEELEPANHLVSESNAGGVDIDLGIGDVTQAAVVVAEVTPVVMSVAETGEIVESAEVDQIHLSEWVGQRKFSAALQKLLTVSDLIELQKIKESKSYKGLRVIGVDGKPLTVCRFGDLCDAIGSSEPHINEQLLNLRTFGPDFLKFADESIGFREMRSLRKMPEDKREALALIAKSGSKDDVLEAAYDLIEQERAAAAEITVKHAELAEDLKLAERRAKNLDAECERKDSQIKRLSQAKVRTTEFLIRTEEIREEAMALQFASELHLNSLKKLFEETDAAAPEGMLQQETLWIVANTIAARALDVIEHMKAIGSPDAQPARPMQRHLLTPDEAVRWLQDYPLIENRFAAEQALRQEKRDAAKPKGPGRPKGSPNKGAEE